MESVIFYHPIKGGLGWGEGVLGWGIAMSGNAPIMRRSAPFAMSYKVGRDDKKTNNTRCSQP